MTTVVGAVRPLTLRPPPTLKLRGQRFRKRSEARAFLGLLEALVQAAAEEGFVDAVAVYRQGKPLYVNQVERFVGTGSILDAVGALDFRAPSLRLELYLRSEAKEQDAYLRLSLGGALERPVLRAVLEWRDHHWRSSAPGDVAQAYAWVHRRAESGAVAHFARGCRAALEALGSRIERLAVGGERPRIELDDGVVVPGPDRLGRLRLVDFHHRPGPCTRIERDAPPPARLLEAFHDDPYDDFVGWSLFHLASLGRWSPGAAVGFRRSDTRGQLLQPEGAAALGVADSDVRIEEGRLVVAKAVRQFRRLEGNLRAYAVPGWGGENV